MDESRDQINEKRREVQEYKNGSVIKKTVKSNKIVRVFGGQTAPSGVLDQALIELENIWTR